VKRASRFGGLPVGFWAAGPSGRVKMAVGRISPLSAMNSDIFYLFC
jgi:hypothetical protein